MRYALKTQQEVVDFCEVVGLGKSRLRVRSFVYEDGAFVGIVRKCREVRMLRELRTSEGGPVGAR